MAIGGLISRRLRELYGPDVGDWPAARVAEAIDDMPCWAYRGVALGDPARGATSPNITPGGRSVPAAQRGHTQRRRRVKPGRGVSPRAR